MTAHGEKTEPPFSRPLALTDVPAGGVDIDIVASTAERSALARLNDLAEVFSFEATLHARPWRKEGLEVTGEIRARVRQTCVVSLEEFDSDIAGPVDARFAPPVDAAPASRRRAAAEPDPAEVADEPDPLIGGAVDLGAVAAEFFTLALDPYPRKPGAAFAAPVAAVEEPPRVSPFAALRDRKT